MSYKTQTIIWDVTDVQIGVSVGYELEFSNQSSFSPTLYKLSTYDQLSQSLVGTFFYSLDDGLTWVNYPLGEQGYAFYEPYKMKVVINSAVSGYIFAEKNGSIYRISADGKVLIESYEIDQFESSGFEVDAQNTLYVTGQDNTCYKIDSSEKFKAGNNSLNLRSNPLGILVDSSRNTFWQIDRKEVSLKDLSGNLVLNLPLPVEIDVDNSSSSSSNSSSSSSSSSSTQILSSSSSSSLDNYISVYPPAQDSTYVIATTTYPAAPPWFAPYFATDPAKSLTGPYWAPNDNTWFSNGVGQQKFNIDLGTPTIIKRIYYENGHNVGGNIAAGIKSFIVYGTNDVAAFLNLNYSNTTNLSLPLYSGQFEQHIASDTADPKYILINNTVAYRYYVFRMYDNWAGVTNQAMMIRRIELQVHD